MPDSPVATVQEDARPFSEYVREENKREREGLPASGDATSASAPVATPADGAAAAEEPESASGTAEAAPEPVTDEAAEEKADEKNPDLYVRKGDGTFKKRTAQDRINIATARQREAERKAAQFAQELAALRAQAAPVPTERAAERGNQPATPPTPVQQPSGKPVLEQYLNAVDPYGAWMEALAEWTADQRLQAYQQQQAQYAEQARVSAQVVDVMETGQEAHPDWNDVMSSDFAQKFVSPPLMEAVYSMDSPELSAEAMYFLGTHEQEARDLAALANKSPLAASVKLGHYLASSAASSGSATGATISRAKPLIRPVGASPMASAPSPPDPEKTSFADWVKVNNAADRKARKEGRA